MSRCELRLDRRILFTALAFVAVVLKGTNTSDQDSVEQIRHLSELIEAFCASAVPSPDLSDDSDASAIDLAIEQSIQQWHERLELCISDNNETLIALMTELRRRRLQRMQRELCAVGGEAELRDLVSRDLREASENDGLPTRNPMSPPSILVRIVRTIGANQFAA